ncbi:hypothetical protein Acj9p176 [Acinetobacter phage Acj9]|uniref:Uncharacterized protein n=1 Tax=Acinetobacter phage Acj9 TaxID=760939 RepID=E5EPW0_9CAUD|nr:hypothetical protein Acj9p176 [Acinetobacter phage Acj9]ADG60076.1 hypothetical protein Acj9p176 [Acinetobacter phage Acj9]
MSTSEVIYTKEIIEDFKQCRDDFDYFKDKYAKNNSYVCAFFAHKLIFTHNSTSVIMCSPKMRLVEMRGEIRAIINALPPVIGADLISRDNTQYMSTKHYSCIMFRAENPNSLRGPSLNYLYHDGKDNIRQAAPWMVPTDIPNLYKSTLGHTE